jgi:Flp pilus assembly secretin CpaC
VNLTSIARPATAAAIVAMAAVAIPEALAQEPTTTQSGTVQAVTGSAQRIIMTMGKGQLFETSVPFTKISVTDEKIVDVTPQSNREFVFTPKGIGSTNVLVFDEKNRLIATLDINVVGTHEAREVTYDEVPGRVRIYNVRGSFAKPLLYQCNMGNCELVRQAPNVGPGPTGEAPSAGPGPIGTTTTSPKESAPSDNENSQ